MRTSVGFIGTGIMGRSMAGHLLAAGHPLHVFNRTRAKAQDLLDRGATWHESPGDVAAAADVVITMVGLPADVEEVHLGGTGAVPRGRGIVDRARPGAVLVDMTTSSPVLAARIAAAAAARGVAALDAPVTGGDVGARNATLVIMAGGDAATLERVRPILARLGRSIAHLGPAGAGQRCKLANQVAVAIGMVAWCEALAHARAGGLDPAAVRETIAGGAAGSWALEHLAPRALAADFAPGFLVRHLLKDIAIARAVAAETATELPGLEVAERLYRVVAERGGIDDGTQALYGLYAGRR